MITDFSKYKRLFTFGCSFTGYFYPTWADIISKSMNPDVAFYNLGKSGGGNLFISSRITEANNKYKFTDTDLVAVMWSTHARIDHYRTDTGWITPGNIYTQSMLDMKTVMKLADLNWFLMRDLSVIELTTQYLDNLPCDTIKLMSVPFDYDPVHHDYTSEITDSIYETYNHLLQKYPKTMFEYLDRKWPGIIKYHDPALLTSGIYTDYHPSPVHYAEYLKYCNIPIKQESFDYARESNEYMINNNLSKPDIINHFSDCDERISLQFKQLW